MRYELHSGRIEEHTVIVNMCICLVIRILIVEVKPLKIFICSGTSYSL